MTDDEKAVLAAAQLGLQFDLPDGTFVWIKEPDESASAWPTVSASTKTPTVFRAVSHVCIRHVYRNYRCYTRVDYIIAIWLPDDTFAKEVLATARNYIQR